MSSAASLSSAAGRERSIASVQVSCPRCEVTSSVPLTGGAENGAAGTSAAGPLADGEVWRCPSCGWRATGGGPAPRPGRAVERCWVCDTDELYVQKDFNRELGRWIVIVSALVIFLVMLWQGHLVGLGLLLAIALVDWIAYRWIRNVSVCYLCHSIYRGLPLGEKHSGFYLGTEEKYKKLRRKWLQESVAEPPAAGGDGA